MFDKKAFYQKWLPQRKKIFRCTHCKTQDLSLYKIIDHILDNHIEQQGDKNRY